MSVQATIGVFNPQENIQECIIELEEKRDLYESEMAYYSGLIQEYKAYIATFNGNYWEDDTIHRDEAYRRHYFYCLWRETYEDLRQQLTQIISDISIMKTDLQSLS